MERDLATPVRLVVFAAALGLAGVAGAALGAAAGPEPEPTEPATGGSTTTVTDVHADHPGEPS